MKIAHGKPLQRGLKYVKPRSFRGRCPLDPKLSVSYPTISKCGYILPASVMPGNCSFDRLWLTDPKFSEWIDVGINKSNEQIDMKLLEIKNN